MAACLKPTGYAVQSDSTATTLHNALAWALPPPIGRPDRLKRAKTCHRIDKASALGAACAANSPPACHCIGMARESISPHARHSAPHRFNTA